MILLMISKHKDLKKPKRNNHFDFKNILLTSKCLDLKCNGRYVDSNLYLSNQITALILNLYVVYMLHRWLPLLLLIFFPSSDIFVDLTLKTVEG